MQESEARRTVQPALEPGEQVHWCGAPVADRVSTRWVAGLLLRFGVVVVVTYFLLRTSYGSGGAGIGNSLRSLLQAAAADPGLLIPAGILAATVLGFVSLMVLDRRRLSHTAYAITDRRLLAVVGPKAKVPWAIGPDQVAYVKVKDLGGGMGDVRFNRYPRTNGLGSRNTDRLYTFERLEDPDRLARRARNWLAEIEPAAVAEARDLRRVVDAEEGFELEVPASWSGGATPDHNAAFGVLSDSGSVRAARSGNSRSVLGLHGPLGAALGLEVAPAGTWRLEQLDDGAHGLARLLLKVVEGPEEIHDGPAPGFKVTYETRRVQQLAGSAGVYIEFIILEWGESQLRFTLTWMSQFEGMREVLEEVVRSLRPSSGRSRSPSP